MDMVNFYVASFIMVIAVIIISSKQKIGFEKDIAVASVKGLIQLLALGYALKYLFSLENPFFLIPIILFMCFFAAHESGKRISRELSPFRTSFLSIFTAAALTLAAMYLLRIIPLELNKAIPVAGMAVGKAMNAYTIAMDRLEGEVASNMETVEGKIALGATLSQALHSSVNSSIRSSMIPSLNNLAAVGVVFIPGLATGMLLAGAL